MKILVVDDFATMRRIVKNILNSLGYHDIYFAEDGVDAVNVLANNHIDFIVTDWNMPRMSGIELLKLVRSSSKTKSIPVLMVTAESKRDQIVMAAKEGVNGYIIKPFTAELMKRKIDLIFSRIDNSKKSA